MVHSVMDIFALINEIGKNEVGILCRTSDDLSAYIGDTALFSANLNRRKPVRSVAVCIDLDNLVFYLCNKRHFLDDIDLIITHHPIGKAQYAYPEIFNLFKYILDSKINICNHIELSNVGLKRLKNFCNSTNPYTHEYIINAGIDVICVHSIADICANNHLNRIFSDFSGLSLLQLTKTLSEIPAISAYRCDGLFPYIVLGNEHDICKDIFFDLLNCTVEVPEYLEILKRSGIDTIVTMHVTQEYLDSATKNRLNLINLGHIPADNLGMNIVLDKIAQSSEIVIKAFNGFIRTCENCNGINNL